MLGGHRCGMSLWPTAVAWLGRDSLHLVFDLRLDDLALYDDLLATATEGLRGCAVHRSV